MIANLARAVCLCAIATLTWATSSAAAAWSCRAGTTMTVTAHEDDTLLFMSPDIIRDVRQGRCLRSVVTTSGSHWDISYMHQREAGMEAAYAQMAGVPDAWTQLHVRVGGHPIAEARLRRDPRIRIDFLALPNNAYPATGPDPSTGAPSLLSALERGWIPSLTTIDGPTVYTRQDIVSVLLDFMRLDRPDRVDTQDFVDHYGWGDHSDHRATAFMTLDAWRRYDRGTLVSYLGYTAGLRAPNVFGPLLTEKTAAWHAYVPFDANVPQTEADGQAGVYEGWLRTEYRLTSVTTRCTSRARCRPASAGSPRSGRPPVAHRQLVLPSSAP